MGSTVFKSGVVATLKDELSIGKDTATAPSVINSTTDPTASAVDAEPGSLLLNRTTGIIYKKNDSGSTTNWSAIGASSANEASLLENHGLATSAAAGALTIDLKQFDGTSAPSGGSPVRLSFLSSTLTSGSYVIRSVTAALSVTITSGATLGYANGDNAKVYIYALDNAGTVELAVSGRRIFHEDELQSTTAMDATADSSSVLYSTTARSNVAVRYLGYTQVDAITTAGTWTTPDSLRLSQDIVGIEEYKEVILTTPTTTVTADTPVDVTGGSLTLSPGTWDIGYDVCTKMDDNSGATNNITGVVYITDSANTLQDGSQGHVGSSALGANEVLVQSVSRRVQRTITSETTYKLRIICTDSSATGTFQIEDQEVNTGITAIVDNASVFWARRVR